MSMSEQIEPWLLQKFQEIYGIGESPLMYFAPGRVNLIGEHTDYNGGLAMPFAINKGTYLVFRRNNSSKMNLVSMNYALRKEFFLKDDFIKVSDQWTNYPLAVFNEYFKRELRFEGWDMMYWGNLPTGSGLSSSASIEMVTSHAINTYYKAGLNLKEEALLCQMAENNFVGVQCGIMDQLTIALGETGKVVYMNTQTLATELVEANIQPYTFVIINSNKQRQLAESKYNERVAECQTALSYLRKLRPLNNLSEVDLFKYAEWQVHIKDDVASKRALHVISENERVKMAYKAFASNQISSLGMLLNESHNSLKNYYEVTGLHLDTLAELAQQHPGVLGARMTGAGFGGCTINMVHTDHVENFIHTVGKEYIAKTGLKADFYPVTPSRGVSQINL